MAWITLTAADVQNRLAKKELDALTLAAKAETQDAATILSEAIEKIVVKVRGYVAACNKNTLGPSGSIPEELAADALALIRDYLFTRLPGMKALNDEIRQKETERAVAALKDAARCLIAIVPPEVPAPEQAGGPAVQLIGSRRRVASREQTRGLM